LTIKWVIKSGLRELDSTGELGMAEDVTLSSFMMRSLASKKGSQVSSQHQQDI